MHTQPKGPDRILHDNSLEFLPNILKLFPNVARFSILQFNIPPQIQERATLSRREGQLIKSAATLRKKQGFCFSEILLAKALKDRVLPKGIISGLGYHQKHAKKRLWVHSRNVQKVNIGRDSKASKFLPWAISSRVKTASGAWKHIPLMDFHINISPYALDVVLAVGKEIFGESFLILESDRSYHGVGLSLLSDTQFLQFLARAILFSPIVDHAYIAHQLIEREASLRITKKTPKGVPPRIVCCVKKGKVYNGTKGL